MKVLVAHNFYQQPGGEDQCFADTLWLLESRGHEVVPYTADNDEIAQVGRLRTAAGTFWSQHTYRELSEVVRRERPEVVHFMNTFPLISPSAYYAARAGGAAVVQELQNYRLMCPGGVLMREGKVCQACVGRTVAWPGVVHGCYRGSRGGTAVVAGMLAAHRLAGTWRRAVDAYIAVTEFGRAKLIEGGLPAERLFVKPNVLHPDPGVGDGQGGYAVFVGRLATEKGITTLLAAWEKLAGLVPLRIVGDGPLAGVVAEAAKRLKGITWVGRQSAEGVVEQVSGASCLVLPSLWFEGLPKTLVEAMAMGTPVIASRLGALQELVTAGETGLLFEVGNAQELAARVRELVGSPEGLGRMRTSARQRYERQFSADRGYAALMRVYEAAQGFAGQSRRCRGRHHGQEPCAGFDASEAEVVHGRN
jgi:glycosyltransferase involved in cell wall biosynthesis